MLVLDDDPDIGELVEATASGLGIDCVVTHAVSDFLNGLVPEIDLILLDLVLPDIDGIEVLRSLGERHCHADVILMSGLDKRVIESAERVARAHGLKVKGHLCKPFRVSGLEAILSKAPKLAEQKAVASAPIEPITEQQMRKALDGEEFCLYYQPQISLADSRVIGFEGLARWISPDRGMVPPDRFIPELERAGLVEAFTWQIVERGLQEAAAFHRHGCENPTLSINISAQSLYDLHLPDRILASAERHGFEPDRMVLEITESGLIQELSRTLDVLTRLRLKGVELSIDDFGTGYSMLQQLQLVPATELKIDRLFVKDLHQDEGHRVVVQKTIELGHELGMRVVAEGVEHTEQAELLRSWGCDAAQGYLYSRPLPPGELLSWLSGI
ncbi:MAG: EAL domain-containing protein [Acidobacteriota bacterium]